MTKILLVEDDKSLREIYGVRLLAEGYDIVSAGDGEEALAMAIKERPALIVSDVMMPKISGFDMLDILRSTTETKDIKVIMMTALSSDDQRERGEKLGADRYLVKSQVGIEDVVRAVHEVLGDLPGLSGSAVTPASQLTPQPNIPPQQPIPPASPTLPTAPQTPAPASTALPEPMAPFSSPAPRPAGLGDRALQPIQPPATQTTDISKMMEQELSNASASDTTPTAPSLALDPAPATPSLASDPTPVTQPLAPAPIAPPPTPAPAPPATPSMPEPVTRPDIASLSPRPIIDPTPTAQPQQSPPTSAFPQSPPTQ